MNRFSLRPLIVRSNPSRKSDYHDYITELETDFHRRCAYCDLSKESITTPFEIDHFIPRSVLVEIDRNDLVNDYKNLVYSCKKCNRAKWNKCELSSPNAFDINLTNNSFFDPSQVDFNTIFFRDSIGNIKSSDAKGKKMIIEIGLTSPIHSLGWLIDQLSKLEVSLSLAAESEINPTRKNKLIEAHYKILKDLNNKTRLFIANYNSVKNLSRR